jgi:hypothetical protein
MGKTEEELREIKKRPSEIETIIKRLNREIASLQRQIVCIKKTSNSKRQILRSVQK